jgi:signal transduction histidine kinase/DNA-binding NarL/FixJ family response regulator/HPt (histidine-containing phosphotransfer) domain-containing protein
MSSSPSQRPLAAPPTAELLPSGARLQLRLTLLTLLLVGLLTALSASLVRSVFSSMTPSLSADLRWKAQRGVAELSYSADFGVLTANQPLLLEAAKHYTDDADFLYVQFRNGQRQVLFEQGSGAGLPTPEETPEAVVENSVAFSSWAPVVIEGLRVGDVTLAVSKQRLQAGAELYRRMLILGLLGAAAALGVALWFVRSHVVPILRITERTSLELQRTAKAALASAEAKSQFLANMSHEIRTPMNGVLGMLHLAKQTDLNVQQRRYLEIMSTSARALLKVVNDILNFSKLDAGGYQLRPEPCSPRELIEETKTLFEQRAAEKGLQLNAEIAASVPDAVLLDADRFRQILANLVGNAIKFTERGSVKVSVLARPARPGLASGAAPALEVFVDDTGPGIPEDAQPRLFQAFSQVDESSRRAHEGTGLGLAICKQLVELMGGSIGYRQQEEGGSRFYFLLPLAACERPQRSTGAPPEPVVLPANDRPVLLVDDNEVNQIVAVELLEGLGLRVDVASSGEDAIEAVQSGDYALILMDCQMPGMDGYEATREIRRRHPGRKLPIVAFTAHALADERDKVLRAGMDDYLTKPIEPTELAAVLSRQLGSAPRPVRSRQPLPARVPSRPPPPAAADVALLQPGLRRPPKAVEAFLRKTPDELVLLEQAVREQRRDELRRLAHKLKGSAGSLGALQLARLCEGLEHATKDASDAGLSEIVVTLRAAYQRVSAALQQQQSMQRGAP